MIFIFQSLTFILLVLIVCLTLYFMQRSEDYKLWNNGKCSKCGKLWKFLRFSEIVPWIGHFACSCGKVIWIKVRHKKHL